MKEALPNKKTYTVLEIAVALSKICGISVAAAKQGIYRQIGKEIQAVKDSRPMRIDREQALKILEGTPL